MKKEIENIKNKYYMIAKKINAPVESLHFYDIPKDLAYPHIEYENGEYAYVITERGIEFERRITSDPDIILFWLINSLTFELASKYELNHREESKDSRRLLFKHQLELLEKINPEWAKIEKEDQDKILKNYPYDDCLKLRNKLEKDLINQGLSNEEAWKKACERYPEPEGMWGKEPPIEIRERVE